jgi:hypothetical protein
MKIWLSSLPIRKACITWTAVEMSMIIFILRNSMQYKKKVMGMKKITCSLLESLQINIKLLSNEYQKTLTA